MGEDGRSFEKFCSLKPKNPFIISLVIVRKEEKKNKNKKRKRKEGKEKKRREKGKNIKWLLFSFSIIFCFFDAQIHFREIRKRKDEKKKLEINPKLHHSVERSLDMTP